MERKIGEIFEYTKDGETVKLKVEHNEPYIYCNDCYFNNINTHCYYKDNSITGSCFSLTRSDKKHVIFKLVNMCENKEEKRNVELTLEKAKEWYKQGGELKEVALQAFSESELKDSKSHSWGEFCTRHFHENLGYFIDVDSTIKSAKEIGYPMLCPLTDKYIFPTKEYTEAALALCKLLHLRQEWIGDWKPNWKNENSDKYIIYVYNDFISIRECTLTFGSISFPSEKMANEFLNDFRELLEIAKPLL